MHSEGSPPSTPAHSLHGTVQLTRHGAVVPPALPHYMLVRLLAVQGAALPGGTVDVLHGPTACVLAWRRDGEDFQDESPESHHQPS